MAKKTKNVKEAPADVVDQITKAYGAGLLVRLGAGARTEYQTIPTGSLGLDDAIGIGGWPRGRIVELWGKECVAASTRIAYQSRTLDGRPQNVKGGTIENLWYRFHRQPRPGKGNYQRPETENSEYYAPSINEHGCVFQNRILDVVKTGRKECYRVQLLGGASIVCTMDHEFYTGDGDYEKLQHLQAGDRVFIHNNTPARGRKKLKSRPTICVKYHPVAPTKIVRDPHTGAEYEYKRTARSRLAYEAHMNGLTFSQYRDRLNSGELDDLVFLDKDQHVHHIDEDFFNDEPSNLQVLTPEEHGRLHAAERRVNLSFVAVEDEIASIEYVGEEDTYDLTMEAPAHNYVADGIVVHNSSGKSTMALHALAEAQAQGLECAYVDAEHALDLTYAAGIGVDTDGLLVSQPDCGEQALGIVQLLAESGQIGVVVVDSVAALTPKAEIEGEVGDHHVGLQARLMSQSMRKLVSVANRTDTLVIFINQLRQKIGVSMGSPWTTTGGNALKFYASIRCKVERIGSGKKGEEKINNRTRVSVVKNKCAPPFKQCEFDIAFGTGIDREGELIEKGVACGVVDKAGAWLSFNGEKLGQGIENAKRALREDPALAGQILGLVRNEEPG